MNFLQKCCIAMAMALLMTGCFNKHESPEAVTMAYFRALAAEDFDDYRALMPTDDVDEEHVKKFFNHGRQHYKRNGGISDVEIIRTEYGGDEKDFAVVHVKVKLGNGNEEEPRIEVSRDPDTKKWFH